MTRWQRIVLGAAASVCIAGIATYAALTRGWFELSRAELEGRYALPVSRFAMIDGTRMHYTDEGSGPAVLLLPASYMNLRSWDPVAAILSKDFRVIRVDFPVLGLSGPEPDRDYSIEGFLRVTHGLIRSLGVEDVNVVGTSSGGIVAFRYAAEWPDEVARLVLINSAGMPRTAATNPNRARGTSFEQWRLSHYKPRSYWEESLRAQFPSEAEPPEWLIDLVHDLNRREGIDADGRRQLELFRTGDPESVLAQVRAPTLILWGVGNITVSHLEADVYEHWLTGAPSFKKKYADLGHYPYIERPQAVAQDIRDFLQGRFDAQLRVTERSAP